MIKSYFQLVRIPGIFTAFTNVLLGFLVVQETNIEWSALGALLTTSGFLFLAGMTLNDYFDYFTDKNERPERPLPSGKIARKTALYYGIGFLVAANLFSLMVSLESVLVSLVMTGLILSYDIKTKNIQVIGILNLSTIRFFNVILGSTVISFNPEIIKFAIPIAIFVAGISILAKKETMIYVRKTQILNFIFIISTIISVLVITSGEGEFIYLIFLALFSAAVIVPYRIFNDKTNQSIQKIVTSQLLAITILDGTLIASVSNPIYGIIASIMYVPSYLILRKMYLT